MDLSPVWISAKTASVSIVITFFLGTAAAFFIFRMRHERLKILWDAILTLPLVLPPTVAGFFLLYIFIKNYNIITFARLQPQMIKKLQINSIRYYNQNEW